MKIAQRSVVLSFSAVVLLLVLPACSKAGNKAAATSSASAVKTALIQYPALPPVFNVVASGLDNAPQFSGVGRPILSVDARSMAFVSANALTNDPSVGYAATGNLYSRVLNSNLTSLISMNTSGFLMGGYTHQNESVSFAQNGNFAVFTTTDTTAAAGIVSGARNYLIARNLNTGVNSLVGASAGWLTISHQSVSSDGSFVAFNDSATNLIYRKNMNTASLQVVSTKADGVTPTLVAYGFTSGTIAISPNGNRVAYIVADASKVSSGTGSQLVVADLITNAKMVASVSANGIYSDGNNLFPVLSEDGNTVVFYSSSQSLLPVGAGTGWQVIAKNLTNGALSLVSSDSAGIPLNSKSVSSGGVSTLLPPSISNDGRFVCFTSSEATSLVPSGFTGKVAIVKDIQTGAVEVVSKSSKGVIATANDCSLSGDGRFASFGSSDGTLTGGTTTPSMSYIYLRQITSP